MPRKIRVRIATGVTAIVIGVAVSSLVPAFFILMDQSNLAAANKLDIDGVQKQLASFQRLETIVIVANVVGRGISIVGFAIAFISWLVWFVRDETPDSGAPS